MTTTTYREKLERFAENGLDQPAMSPMEPPPAYDLHKPMEVAFEEFSLPLQALIKEHEHYVAKLEEFEKALMAFKETQFKLTAPVSNAFSDFFRMVGEEMIRHHTKEEKMLFPVLKKRLIESGESNHSQWPTTPCDVMEDDHQVLMITTSLVMNLLGIATKLTDDRSQYVLFHYAYEQAKEAVESLRLHIFKENHVLFPLAQKLLTVDEMKLFKNNMDLFDSSTTK